MNARAIGLSDAEFWGMTLRDLFREFVVARRAAKVARQRDLSLAWHTGLFAGLARFGKLPPLRDVLHQEPQTKAEQAATWRHLADSFGWKVKKFDKRKSRIVRFPKPA